MENILLCISVYSDRVELGFIFACGPVVEVFPLPLCDTLRLQYRAIHILYIYKSCKCGSIENVSDVFTELKS